MPDCLPLGRAQRIRRFPECFRDGAQGFACRQNDHRQREQRQRRRAGKHAAIHAHYANEQPKAEKLVEVRLLRDYVPAGAEADEGVFPKVKAGEVIKLPRDEAKKAIELKIAEVSADLV